MAGPPLTIMIVFLNGEFLPAEAAKLSIFDRGFLYGDGLFETLRIYAGRPFLWEQHLQRLTHGADVLAISLPLPAELLAQRAAELILRNGVSEGTLRITLTRGTGPRGYAPGAAREPTLAMSVHAPPSAELPEERFWRVVTSHYQVPVNDPLTRLKTCNKLPHILARAQAERVGADDALLLNTEQTVAEATSANLFWVEGESLWTPPLSSGPLAGVTRAVVMQLAKEEGLDCGERVCPAGMLPSASGAFLTLSSLGLVEVSSVDDVLLPSSAVTRHLRAAYGRFVARHLSSPS